MIKDVISVQKEVDNQIQLLQSTPSQIQVIDIA